MTELIDKVLKPPITSVMRGVHVGAGGFVPQDVTILENWWNYNLLSSLYQDDLGATPVTADAEKIGRCVDTIGNIAAVQSVEGNKPTYNTNQQNGGSVATFNGTSTTMLADLGATKSQPNTILVVVKFNAASDYACDGKDNGTRQAIYTSGSSKINSFASANIATTANYTGGFQLVVSRFDGANGYLRVDGTETTGDNGTHGTDKITIGSKYNPNTWLNGAIKHVLFFNGALSAADLSSVENYFNVDMGL